VALAFQFDRSWVFRGSSYPRPRHCGDWWNWQNLLALNALSCTNY